MRNERKMRMTKTCKHCIYRDEGCAEEGAVCSDFFEGSPEDLAEHETDLSEFIGEESFEDFMEHEDLE